MGRSPAVIRCSNEPDAALYSHQEPYKQQAERLFSAFGRQIQRGGVGFKMLAALEAYYDRPKNCGGDSRWCELCDLLRVLRRTYLPNRVFIQGQVRQLNRLVAEIPWAEYKLPLNKQATGYVCEAGLCEHPTNDPKVFAQQLGQRHPLITTKARQPLKLTAPQSPPQPWEYNPSTNQHWHPGHGHWHDGPPPQKK